MDEKNGELDRLCKVYKKLKKGDKEKVIRLAEGLLNSQEIIGDKKKLQDKIG
jgi:hypothetical protein